MYPSHPAPVHGAAGPSLTKVWGVADDDTAVEVLIPGTMAAMLASRWPPIGLTRSDVSTKAAQLHLSIQIHPPDAQPSALVNGEPSPGEWDRLESELALFAAERIDQRVAVHAAVIVHCGRAVLVPGMSGAGKSSLCVAAVAAGATVLTDEYALVDPVSGWVTGWLRPVRVRRADGGVDRLDLAVASGPVPVGLVALVTYSSSEKPTLAPIAVADTVLGLLANTVCARSRPDESFTAALAIGRSVPAVGGIRGDATEAIAELLTMLDGQATRTIDNT